MYTIINNSNNIGNSIPCKWPQVVYNIYINIMRSKKKTRLSYVDPLASTYKLYT